jgi:hypothetical protein
LFFDLSMKANFKENNAFFLWNQEIIQQKGDIIFSMLDYSKQNKISQGKVKNMLVILEKSWIIENKFTNKYTVIKVLKGLRFWEDWEQIENKLRTNWEQIETINKEKKEKKEKNKENFFENEKLNNALNDFCAYRQERKKPLTKLAKTKTINKIKEMRLKFSDNEIISFIDNSITAGRTWIFAKWDKNNNQNSKTIDSVKDWMEWWKKEKEQFAKKYWDDLTIEYMNTGEKTLLKYL